MCGFEFKTTISSFRHVPRSVIPAVPGLLISGDCRNDAVDLYLDDTMPNLALMGVRGDLNMNVLLWLVAFYPSMI
jgi:hypothetical protein